jgi:alpha-galactosidase
VELGIPIIEALGCGEDRNLPAINVRNDGAIPNLAADAVVEIPGRADSRGIRRVTVDPLPEALAAVLRLQCSINKLLVEAYAECSRDKLVQAALLDPAITTYRSAVDTVDELLILQKAALPHFH